MTQPAKSGGAITVGIIADEDENYRVSESNGEATVAVTDNDGPESEDTDRETDSEGGDVAYVWRCENNDDTTFAYDLGLDCELNQTEVNMGVQEVVQSYRVDLYAEAPPNPSEENQFNQHYSVEGCSFLYKGLSGGSYRWSDVVVCPVPLSSPVDGPSVAYEDTVQGTVAAVTAATVSNVTTNIGTRFSAARGGGTALTLAGQPVFAGRSGQALAAMERSAKAPAETLVAEEASWGRAMSAEQLLQTSTFELSLNAAEDGSGGLGLAHWTLWGRGDILVFDSDPSTGPRYDGDLRAGYLGLDAWINGRWLVGVAASRTQVDAEYRLDDGDGALDVTLTSVHPYVRFAPDGRRELWAILGAGTGEVENARTGAPERESTDVEMYMAAAGVRQALEPLASGVAIALLGDAGFGRLDGDAGSGLQTLDNLSVDTWRARAGAEVSYTMAREGGTSITPFAEIAGRVDGGGEDDTKAGVEVSAGVAYADPASGFGLEARGRTLVLYSGGDYREYGASLTASLSPGAGGEGLSLALSPRLGIDPGRTDVLWREDPFRALNTDRPEPALSLDAEIGYGISVASGRGLATPFGELRVGNGESRRARAGIRFGMPGPANRVNLEFAGARQEDRINAPEHRVELIGRVRF